MGSRHLKGRPGSRPWFALIAAILALESCSDPEVRWLPSGRWVAWASNREGGRHEIYRLEVDSGQILRLTSDGGRRPLWAPDGRWIAYYRESDWTTHVVRPDGSEDKLACRGVIRYWMPDNSGMVCRKGDVHSLVDPDREEPDLGQELYRLADFKQLASGAFDVFAATHDGRYLLAATDLYRGGYTGSNGTFKAEWAAVVVDRQHPDQLHYFGAGCEPTAPPQGDLIYHVGRGCATCPDVNRMRITDLATRSSYVAEMAHPENDWGHEYFPSISNDNAWLVYGATTGCHDFDACDYEIFLHRLGQPDSDRRRLTVNAANDQWPTIFVAP